MIFEFALAKFSEVAIIGIALILSLVGLLVLIAMCIKPEGNRLLARLRCKKSIKAVDVRDI